jgi:hypothetical protein
MTPLHWAIEKGYDNIAELLLENGANPHVMSKFLKTPYTLAKEKNNDFVVNLIEMLPSSTPKTPLSANNQYDSSVFTKTPSIVIKEEPQIILNDPPVTKKRERFHSYDSLEMLNKKKLKTSPNHLTLQLLKEQMTMMGSDDNSLIQSVLQSGRKIMLSEAGKRLLNDSSLNKFLKIPLNTTISSTPSPSSSSSSSTASTSLSCNKKSSLSPRPSTMTSSRRTSENNADVLEIFREKKVPTNAVDILNMMRSTDLQEVTITQRSLSSSSSTSKASPVQKTGASLCTAINVPKAKAQNVNKHKSTVNNHNNNHQLPSTADVNSDHIRLNNASSNNGIDDDFSKPEVVRRKYLELFGNYQKLKKAFDGEQQKNDLLQQRLTQMHKNFELYKRQQQTKFDSILVLMQGNSLATIKSDTDTGAL